MGRILESTLTRCLLCSLVAGLLSCGPAAEPPAFNVLLITLDTMRADRLGCYGYDRPTSPHLDALARESVVFDLAIAQAAVTPVSHASILTGLEPYNHGLRVLHGLVANRLEESETTLAEVWQETGAPTAAFISAFPVSAAFGLEQGFDHFDEDFPNAGGEGLVSVRGTVNTGKSQRRADATTDAAIAWSRSLDTDEDPFLMWVHYFDPHDPAMLPPRDFMSQHLNSTFRPADDTRASLLRSVYDCETNYMDAHIGRLIADLKEQGLWDNTIVVVVADHGEGLGDHGWWTHGILYQEQIRVPLTIRVPEIAGGIRVSELVRTIDLMPTILEEASVAKEVWPEMDGRSLAEALRTGKLSTPRVAYSESVNMLNYTRPDTADYRDAKNDKYYCLIDGHKKLIVHQLRSDESEFYDLAEDPFELNNLAAHRPAAMDSLLRVLRARDVFSEIMPGMTATDLERLEKLKSLGYVN
jgi:arylsulfatase A-like enzyme